MMSATEAMETLRPLLVQRRAVESLVQIFEAAIQAELAIPELQRQQKAAEKKRDESLAGFAADIEKSAQETDQAKIRAKEAQDAAAQAQSEAVAAAEAQAHAAEQKAKQRAEQAETAASQAVLAATQRIVEAKQEADAEEARLAILKAANIEQEKKLKNFEKKLEDLRSKLGQL